MTPEQVKAAKQKKIVIAGSVLLLALLAYEVPKTMKMLNAKPVANAYAAAPAAATPATPAPAVSSATPAASPTATASATPAVATGGSSVDSIVVNADLTPTPLEGQLTDLTATFTTKDPFKQQLIAGSTSSPPTTTTGTTPAKKTGGSVVPGSGTGTGTTTPAGAPTSAVISINGIDSPVDVAGDFPAVQPLFHLVSLTAKTAKISIAGGSLSSGAPTITLKLNVPTTLMNTADGTRYKLVLVSTSASAATTTPTTTVPSTASPPTTTTTTTTTAPGG
ncbi:MAG: hypothetical protein ACYDA3_04480 [Gaiellaceae bacterium]